MPHARKARKIVGLHGMKHHPGIGHGQHGGGIIEAHHVHIALPLQPPTHEKGRPIGHHPCGYEGQSQTKGGPTAAQHVFAERHLVAETPTAAAHNEQHLHERCSQKHGHNGAQPPLIEANERHDDHEQHVPNRQFGHGFQLACSFQHGHFAGREHRHGHHYCQGDEGEGGQQAEPRGVVPEQSTKKAHRKGKACGEQSPGAQRAKLLQKGGWLRLFIGRGQLFHGAHRQP